MAEPAPQDAAQDPLKELVERLDRTRSSRPEGNEALAGRIASLASNYSRPRDDHDLPSTRTNIAHALEDFERVAGPVPVDPDLRKDLAARAATYPELQTNRLDALLQTTPRLADQALVDRIRQAAADTAERVFQDVPAVHDRAAALEAEVAVSRPLGPRPTATIGAATAQTIPADPRTPDPSAHDPAPSATDPRPASLTDAQREIAAFDRTPPQATPIADTMAAADPIKAVVSRLDKLRPEIEDQDPNLANRIEQLAFDAPHRSPEQGEKFATLVAYALQDAERQGHRIRIDPDLHQRLDSLASTYPGLEHPRLKELVASTPSLEDPELVEEIRYTAQVAADSTNQNSSAISYLVGKLETRLAQNADRTRPNPARPANTATFETTPAARATPQADGPPQTTPSTTPAGQSPARDAQAPAQVAEAAKPATKPATDQARNQDQAASTQPAPATRNQDASRDSRTQTEIRGFGGLVAAALASAQQPRVAEKAAPNTAAPNTAAPETPAPKKAAPNTAAPRKGFLDNEHPLGNINDVFHRSESDPNTRTAAAQANLSSLNPDYETKVMGPRRDAASIEQTRDAGLAARDSLATLHKNSGETVLKRIQEAAAQAPGGIRGVLTEMRQGGRYQDLREAFDSALTEQSNFSTAYKDATAKLGRYADQRTKIAPIVDKQQNPAIAAQLQQLDVEVGEAAHSLPGEQEGHSALEDLKDRAAEFVEFVEKAIEAVSKLLKRNPDAAPASRPSPSPGP